jgi:hypothetical protein
MGNRNDRASRLSPVPGLAIGGVLLLLAILRMPYGYYVFMRWLVTAACAYGAWFAYEGGTHIWTWLLGAAALLFNPIIPFQMHRADWVPFDLIGAVVLLSGALVLTRGLKQTGKRA